MMRPSTATPAILPGVRALVFDVFGTVVDWRSGVAREAAAFLRRHGGDPAAADAFADAWRQRYAPSMEEVRSGRRPFTRLDVLHRESLLAILPGFRIPPEAVPKAEIDDLNLAWHRLDPWPDSVPGLTRLRRRFIVAPLSNANVVLALDMAKRAGLPWDAILGAELVRAYKPTPEAYLRTADLLAMRPDELCLVAAHPSDLSAARQCGLRTCFVPRPLEHGPTANNQDATRPRTGTSQPPTWKSWPTCWPLTGKAERRQTGVFCCFLQKSGPAFPGPVCPPARQGHVTQMKNPSQEEVALPGGPAMICWRRHARARRITLQIDARRGQVMVTLPMRAGRAAGLALVRQNAGWVTARLAALPAIAPFADGGSVTIDGLVHPIRHRPDAHGGAWLAEGALHVSGEIDVLPRRVGDFLRAEAGRRFAAQAIAKAAQAGLPVRRVTVKDTKSRWGSCSSDGVLMFCWRLLMAPAYVQDYVVAHEVAHLRHMDHGPRFWALADSLSPHRVRAGSWLTQEGASLLRVG